MDPELKIQNTLASCWAKQVRLASGSESQEVITTVLPSIEHTVNWIDDYVKSEAGHGVDNVQVLVTGSLHLVGGVQSVLGCETVRSQIMSETTIQDLCLVERILQKRVDADTGAVEYLIKWQGTDAQGNEYEDTWEPEHNILGDELIEEFENRQASRRPGKLLQEAKSQISSPYTTPTDPATQLMGSRQFTSKTSFEQHPPPPGYFHGHPTQYPPHFNHPHYSLPRQLPVQSGSPYNTRTSKRKLPSSANNDRETDVTSDATPSSTTQGNSNKESSSMEGIKRQKDGNSLRSQTQPDKYVERRKAQNTSGAAPATIRPLKLHFDNEKAYFKTIIEKSTLVKDAAVRSEMVRFLKDPKFPGLAHGAKLLESETWLIELKEQKGSSGSLFLALDIPRGEVKALFIPEWMLEYQRKAHPGQGIVLKDRTVVSAIMEGDLHGSGLFPSEISEATEPKEVQDSSVDVPSAPTETEGSPSIVTPSETAETQSTPSATIAKTEEEKPQTLSVSSPLTVTGSNGSKDSPLKTSDQVQRQDSASSSSSSSISSSVLSNHQVETDGDITMQESSTDHTESVQPTLLQCEWKNCQQTRTSLDELSKHVLQDHLQGLLASSSLNSTPPVNVEAAASALAEDSSWQARYELSQATYRSLQDQIARTKDIALKMDQKIQESRILYTSAVAKSKENIKRLEAHLEWEMKKWNKYQEQKSQMAARIVNPDSIPESQRKADTIADGTKSQAESNFSDVEAIKLDKPMEAQSINTIRDIQKTLAAAKEDLARLEEDNLALFEKRRTLDTELKSLDDQFQRTIAQLAELKAKEHTTREEIKSRSQSIEACKATIEQEKIKARQVVNQLQSVIETMRQSGQQITPANGQEDKTTLQPPPSSSSLSPSSPSSLSSPPNAMLNTPAISLVTEAPSITPSLATAPTTTPSQQPDSTRDLQELNSTSDTISNFIDLLTTKVNGAESEVGKK
ncbi:hypothetical protein BGZ49_001677 [Haplosporangium sp. Z 27]|nr:hypothetical protein BGZ49_001677 [Haplosporangium sp. Z 27]